MMVYDMIVYDPTTGAMIFPRDLEPPPEPYLGYRATDDPYVFLPAWQPCLARTLRTIRSPCGKKVIPLTHCALEDGKPVAVDTCVTCQKVQSPTGDQ